MTRTEALIYISDTMTGWGLRRARLALKMTQRELGAAIDLHKNTIARLERDEMPIAKTTELSVKYLLGMRKKKRRAYHESERIRPDIPTKIPEQ